MAFTYTTALSKIRRMTKRKKIIKGGTAASKTYSILPILLDDISKNPGLRVSVASESIPHLKRGAIRDFERIARDLDRWKFGEWNKSNMTFTLPNSAFIEFFSVDDEGRLRGPRRDKLYVNEVSNIKFDAYFQMAIRTEQDIYLDYNPTHEFWADTEFNDDPDAEFLTLTYRDNEACPANVIQEIELARIKAQTSSYWRNWVNVYADGLQGSLEGVIFSNWEMVDELPPDARLIGRGLDFGYTNDPTAIIDVYKWNDYRILDERCYMTKLVNSQVAEILNNDVPIYADSAEPKSIDEIRNCGIHRIEPTLKGADSINYGIQIMQGQKYLVAKRSVNLIKELRGYCWDKDKNGVTLNKPCGADHAIDAVRYHEMMTIGQAQTWDKFWA